MFSGGLDSTGAFWELMKGDDELHVHHLYLVNRENRARAEDRAVRDIVGYMKGLRNFSFTESYHEYPCHNNSFLWDSDLLSFVAGGMCISMPSIRNVAIGMTASDMRRGISDRVERAKRIFEAFGTGAKKVYPVGDKTKKQVYNMLPEDLRALSWSCRTPVYDGDDIKKCGSCIACRDVARITGSIRP
jgi:7-cyano-7-deazaguanine synthase in queuosine biosynthesis